MHHRSPATPYRASKTFAEKAAWDFVNDPANDAKFDLVTMNPPMVFGRKSYPRSGLRQTRK